MPSIPNFKFPTSAKTALELLQLQADVVDRTDGTDDVKEAKNLTEEYAESLWRSAGTPSVKELADVAAGRSNTFGHQVARANSPAFMGAVPKSVGWEEIQGALKTAEAADGLTESSIQDAMAGLGFVRDTGSEEHAGCMVFERGDRTIGVRTAQLGAIKVAEVAVDGDKKPDKNLDDLERGDARTFVAGVLLKPKHWEESVEEFGEVLTEARDALAKAAELAGGSAPGLPVEFAALKKFIDMGKAQDGKVEDAQETKELGALQSQITDLWVEMVKDGTAPKGVMLQFDGPDGAGKTSSSKYILRALMAANEELPPAQQWKLETEVFKAPTDQDKKWMEEGAGEDTGIAKWQWRHVLRGVPEENVIMFKDRFQPGDYVYVGEHTQERVDKMGAEFETYLKSVIDDGVMPFQAVLWADQKKQSKTMGKRMARGAFVDALLLEMKERNTLTPDIEKELLDVKAKVEGSDMKAVDSLKDTLARYTEFAEAAGGVVDFPVIEATDRHEARKELMKRFIAALEEHRGSVDVAG